MMEKLSSPQKNQLHGFKARRIWTMDKDQPFIENGLLVVDDSGTVAEVGSWSSLKSVYAGRVTDLGPVSIAPGVINCHTHLEMSAAAGKTRLGQGFEDWAESIISQDFLPPSRDELSLPLHQLKSCGTAKVCDVTSRHPLQVASALKDADILFHLFVEFIGFRRKESQQLRWPKDLFSQLSNRLVSASGHALYSTSPIILQMAKAWDSQNNRPFSIHLAEHTGELEFLATGRGKFADMLSQRLVPHDFVPPGLSPVAYADRLGLLDSKTLAVHCVHLSDEDIRILQRTNTTVCLCPRSNAAIGVGRAPWEKLCLPSMPVCLGTDSLASNQDLDLFQEAIFLARHVQIPLSQHDILRYMTTNPARLFERSRLGSLTSGKEARISKVPQELESLEKTR